MTASKTVNRNEPCPCGSGLKYKVCCAGKVAAAARSPLQGYLLAAIGLVVVLAVVIMVTNRRAAEQAETAPARLPRAVDPVAAPLTPTTEMPSTQLLQSPPISVPGALTPQPEGPVPEGKVWSPEHGHWHDVTPGQPAATPLELTPGSVTAMPAPPTPGPQPPGPVPEGKVWSPEHGHWHDAVPTAGAPPPQ